MQGHPDFGPCILWHRCYYNTVACVYSAVSVAEVSSHVPRSIKQRKSAFHLAAVCPCGLVLREDRAGTDYGSPSSPAAEMIWLSGVGNGGSQLER